MNINTRDFPIHLLPELSPQEYSMLLHLKPEEERRKKYQRLVYLHHMLYTLIDCEKRMKAEAVLAEHTVENFFQGSNVLVTLDHITVGISSLREELDREKKELGKMTGL